MGGVKLVLLLGLSSFAAVQSVPWWGDIGAAHGARAIPLSLADVSSQFGRRESERNEPSGFPWRSLAEDGDDKLHLRSSKLPPFDVLDTDQDDAVSLDEWKGYVHKLLDKTMSIISRGTDTVSVTYLLDIAKFHYDNLDACIEANLLEMSSTNFTEIATELERCCYVKFRYSLFAGPPPFELVANSAPTISAHDVEMWLTMQIGIARHDLAEKRVLKPTENDELHLEQLVACAHKKLGPWDETRLNRDQFYDALMEIVDCV
ncbi:hypothetical protein KRP22_009560 [Phytophthora ramorum]|nr:hypothetical protein KRP22_8393 [Phytophthora ramorum]